MHDAAVRIHENAAVQTAMPPDGALLAGHVTPCYAREVLRVNGTRDWLLTLTMKGGAFYRQENVHFEARAGDVVLFEPGAYQNYAPLQPGGWDCFWVHFVARPSWLSYLALPAVGKGLYRYRIEDFKVRQAVATSLRRCIDYS